MAEMLNIGAGLTFSEMRCYRFKRDEKSIPTDSKSNGPS